MNVFKIKNVGKIKNVQKRKKRALNKKRKKKRFFYIYDGTRLTSWVELKLPG